jgi:putative toxin-antitoxin system antitoxin component (TIGR02293 family)
MLTKKAPRYKWPTSLLGASQLREFLGISEKTLERRLKDGEWNAGERLRLEMLERLVAEATRVLGNEQRALDWLYESVPALDNQAPFGLLDTIAGYERARNLLLRTAYGMF